MAFINEYIPVADMEKYQIKQIDKNFLIGGTNSTTWTIDREQDIYLRNVARGREDSRHETTWTFYWKGDLLSMQLDMLEYEGKRGGPGKAHMKLIWIGLPAHLLDQKNKIIYDLKEALTARKDGGVFASCTTYELNLEIAEEV
jgi:hypothetical protein